MLYLKFFHVVFVMAIFQSTFGQRKIKNPKKVVTDKRYMCVRNEDLRAQLNAQHKDLQQVRGCKSALAFLLSVYLTKAKTSPTFYDAWICGGAIVSPEFIITSAACVEDVQHMYAIAGYSKYVNVTQIEKNACTKAARKKVILTCVPKTYDFKYENIEKWALIDIALVQVESPYVFTGTKVAGCSWIPDKIRINYESRYQAPNTDTMVMGWGHTSKWRQPKDPIDYNQPDLQYSSLLIEEKKVCTTAYSYLPKMLPIIEKYMICAMKEGNVDIRGDLIKKSKPIKAGCVGKAIRIGGICVNPNEHQKFINENPNLSPQQIAAYEQQQYQQEMYQQQLFEQQQFQQQQQQQNTQQFPEVPNVQQQYQQPLQGEQQQAQQQQVQQQQAQQQQGQQQQVQQQQTEQAPQQPNVQVKPEKKNDNPSDDETITFDDIIFNVRRSQNNTISYNMTRKAGICQNDHGGPLVTWVGAHEVLIGVASVFQISESYECVGPYLFTSIECNSAFIDCVLNPPATPAPPKKNGTRNGDDDVEENGRKFNALCDLPPELRGFDIVKRRISWLNHPDGPAENELNEDLYYRPQIPLRDLNNG